MAEQRHWTEIGINESLEEYTYMIVNVGEDPIQSWDSFEDDDEAMRWAFEKFEKTDCDILAIFDPDNLLLAVHSTEEYADLVQQILEHAEAN